MGNNEIPGVIIAVGICRYNMDEIRAKHHAVNMTELLS